MLSRTEDLDEEERAACRAVEERLGALLGSKVQSTFRAAGERPPPQDVVTPGLVRAIVRYATLRLPRGRELEDFMVRRITVNGLRFEEWEADPTRIRSAL